MVVSSCTSVGVSCFPMVFLLLIFAVSFTSWVIHSCMVVTNYHSLRSGFDSLYLFLRRSNMPQEQKTNPSGTCFRQDWHRTVLDLSPSSQHAFLAASSSVKVSQKEPTHLIQASPCGHHHWHIFVPITERRPSTLVFRFSIRVSRHPQENRETIIRDTTIKSPACNLAPGSEAPAQACNCRRQESDDRERPLSSLLGPDGTRGGSQRTSGSPTHGHGKTHPWCRGMRNRALKKGAVIVELDEQAIKTRFEVQPSSTGVGKAITSHLSRSRLERSGQSEVGTT